MWRNKIVEIAKDNKHMTFAVADESRMQTLFKVGIGIVAVAC